MTKNGQSLVSAAVLIATLSFASRILGLIRDRVLAGTFGAGDVLDAYYAAFRIPDLVFNLVGLAALSAAFLPIFIRLRGESRARAMAFASRMLSDALLALLVLSCIGVVFATPLFRILAPGFTPEQLALTVTLGRVLFLATILLGCSSVFGGVLQAEKRFLAFASAPLLYNAGIILSTVLITPYVGPVGIAWGVVLGAGGHLAVQAIAAYRSGFLVQWSPTWRDPNVRDAVRLLIPRMLGLATQQVQLIVIAGIASTLAGGSLAVFTLASNIQSVPIALFGVAFAVAAFPYLSEAVATRDAAQFRTRFSATVRQILLLAFPAMVLLLALKAQIVRVLLGTGAFGWEDTVRTLEALEAFGYGLSFAMLVPLLTRSFYAFEDTRTPFVVGIGSDVLGIGAAWVLGRRFGASGLALGVSLAAFVQAVLLLFMLRVKRGPLDGRRIVSSMVVYGLAAFVMGVVIQVVKPVIAVWTGTDTFLGIALQGVVAGGLGFAAYLCVGMLLKSPEITALATALHRHALRIAKLPSGGADESRG